MTSTMQGTHVDVRSLRVRFGRRRIALDGVNLSLDRGVHGLLGPNGAGKTTLMRVLATVLPPTSGTVSLLDTSADGDHQALRQVRRRLGYLPQQFGYYPRFTAREFVEYFAWLKEMSAADVPTAVDRALDRVGLTERADDKLKKLSGGMLRRVGIAQAIVNDPELLLLDEPTAGLDPDQRAQLRELLWVISADACVLVSSHIVEDLADCDAVTVLAGGVAIFTGTSDELTASSDESAAGDTQLERGYRAVLRKMDA